jgi:hypothetical protein
MKAGGRLIVSLVFAALLLGSCATQPSPKTAHPVVVTQQPAKPPDPSNPQEFVATEELYRKTFTEVQEVIAALTKLIAAGDYDGWLAYLSEDYRKTASSPAFLANASGSGVLKKNGIVLRDLKDYFDNVVVRSRMQATLDDITFVDATHVKAITEIKGSSVILYYLESENGRWKVAFPRAGQN